MNNKLILFSIITLLAFKVKGDNIPKSVPGYLGKKTLISLIVKPTIDLGGEEQLYYLKKPLIGCEFERVLDRRGSFNFNLYYGKWDAKDGFERNNGYDDVHLTINNFPISSMVGNITYSSLQTIIAKSYYFKGRHGIAPLGKYFKMGLNLNFLKVNDNQMKYNNIAYNSANEKNGFKISPRFHLELGSKRFFDKNLFFQHGLEVALPFNLYHLKKTTYNSPEEYNYALLPKYANSRQTLSYKFALGIAF